MHAEDHAEDVQCVPTNCEGVHDHHEHLIFMARKKRTHFKIIYVGSHLVTFPDRGGTHTKIGTCGLFSQAEQVRRYSQMLHLTEFHARWLCDAAIYATAWTFSSTVLAFLIFQNDRKEQISE